MLFFQYIESMKVITVKEFKEKQDNNSGIVLIDVREQHEFDAAQMGGILIPMSQIQERYSEIPKEGEVVIQCRSGMRSANVIHFLEQQYGYNNLINLEGGIVAWSHQIDPSIQID